MSTPSSNSDFERDVKTATAARMFAGDGSDNRLDQAIIARRMKVSQATVSRLLKRAEEEKKWLSKTVVYRADLVPGDVRARVEENLYPADLLPSMQRILKTTRLKSLTVFPSGGASIQDQITNFGRSVAPWINSAFTDQERPVNVVGVTWGRTLGSLASAMPGVCGVAPRSAQPIEFVPLCGDPLGLVDSALSSSEVVSQLNASVNAGNGKNHSLRGVPASIPTTFTPEESAAVEKLNRRVVSFAHTFPPKWHPDDDEPKDGYLVSKLDTVLTSVGNSRGKLSFTNLSWTREMEIRPKEFKRCVVGDIGGVWLLNSSLSDADKEICSQWQKAWTGVTQDQLQLREDGSPRIIVLACDAQKAEIVIEAAKMNLIEDLLIDTSLASAIERKLAALL